MYNVIVLGATFAAAGIAHELKKNCLVLEQGLQAGSEFFGALNFGSSYEKIPENRQAKVLQEAFEETNSYSRDNQIYQYLEQADVLFDNRPVKVYKTERGFACVAYGVDGFCTYEAKRVIDTRSSEEISISKTYNMLIESAEKPDSFGVKFHKTDIENHYVLCLPVPLYCGYSEAKAEALRVVQSFGDGQKLILLASNFDYQIKEDYVKVQSGIAVLPSKAYKNPVLAFEAGLMEVMR